MEQLGSIGGGVTGSIGGGLQAPLEGVTGSIGGGYRLHWRVFRIFYF